MRTEKKNLSEELIIKKVVSLITPVYHYLCMLCQ